MAKVKPRRPSHIAQRSISDLTLGASKARDRVIRRNKEMGLSEVMLQFQTPVSGTAAGSVGFATTTLTFDYNFYYAPGNRDSDLERPQFWFGVEIDGEVFVSCAVTSWETDVDTGATTGATVRLGVMSGGDIADFTGVLHSTFQGFGAINDSASADGTP